METRESLRRPRLRQDVSAAEREHVRETRGQEELQQVDQHTDADDDVGVISLRRQPDPRQPQGAPAGGGLRGLPGLHRRPPGALLHRLQPRALVILRQAVVGTVDAAAVLAVEGQHLVLPAVVTLVVCHAGLQIYFQANL